MGLIAHSTVIPSIIALVAMVSSSMAEYDFAFYEGLDTFSNNMLQQVMLQKGDSNIIYSPLAIHACLTMARMAAEGDTAKEMDTALGFKQPQSIQNLAENYHTVLAKYEDSSILHLANKLYVMKGNHLDENFSDILINKFISRPEEMNFANAQRSSKLINEWIVDATDNKIKEIISSSELSSDTTLMLLSAINFNGRWQYPFERDNTRKRKFYTSEDDFVEVDMMYTAFTSDKLKYGIRPKFEYVRMPYKNSDLSMWVFVPVEITGLNDMLQILRKTTLQKLSLDMNTPTIDVTLPKFKAELEIDLSEPLQTLGMSRLFEAGSLSKMLKTPNNLKISKIVHKAVIEVNESGTKSSAATGLELMDYSMPTAVIANHPFYYVIANEDHVIMFQGTVVKF